MRMICPASEATPSWNGGTYRWSFTALTPGWRHWRSRLHPEAVPIFGGTDVMVDLNFDRERPGAVLDLTRVPELGSGMMTKGSARWRGGSRTRG